MKYINSIFFLGVFVYVIYVVIKHLPTAIRNELDYRADIKMRKAAGKSKQIHPRDIIRRFINDNYPLFKEISSDNNSYKRYFVLFQMNLGKNFINIIFQTNKWGNGFWVEVFSSNSSDVWSSHGNNKNENNRVGYFKYYSKKQLLESLEEANAKIEERISKII